MLSIGTPNFRSFSSHLFSSARSAFSAVKFFYLPYQVSSAAENMARDFLLLESFPEPLAPRVRFYGWARPAWTFGYSQPWKAARAASGAEVDLIRRPTGGGLVDHRADWTYALVLPAAHPLALARACDSYRAVHEALAETLRGESCPVELVDCQSPTSGNVTENCPEISKGRSKSAPLQTSAIAQSNPISQPSSIAPRRGTDLLRPTGLSVCFRQPERFDLVRADDGRKIAGAAQKRTRAGLLLQGSVSRAAAREVRDWEKFGANFINHLGKILTAQPTAWNEAPHPEPLLAETTARFASAAWNQKR
jgi:lipoate-protein ligase A